MDYEYDKAHEEYEQEILDGAKEYSTCWQRSEDQGWFYSDVDEGETAGHFVVEDDD